MPAQQIDVIAAAAQLVKIINAYSVDKFHDQNMRCGKLAINLRAGNVIDVAVQMIELINMIGFQQEIHLLLGNRPHFIQTILKSTTS